MFSFGVDGMVSTSGENILHFKSLKNKKKTNLKTVEVKKIRNLEKLLWGS